MVWKKKEEAKHEGEAHPSSGQEAAPRSAHGTVPCHCCGAQVVPGFPCEVDGNVSPKTESAAL